jgi:superfamily I DNA/RNA helicase
MQKLLAALNPEQRSAVEATEGPLLVLAGAGTGKTRVITYRIAHLLSRKVPAEAILALTFTNKAAGEMRQRLLDLVGKKRGEGLVAGTFHSFCLTILREHGRLLGWRGGPTICDEADRLATMRSVLRELHVSDARIRPGDLAGRISLLKNRLVTPEELADRATDPTEELVARAWGRYQEELRRTRRVDFDDLLVESVRLLRDHEPVRTALQKRHRYILVDEYQDTNQPQYEVVRHIAAVHRNLCVVGDDDQSIYGWRGADVTKILSFERDFPGARVVRLETNYRSTRDILNVANRLIVHNPARHEKTLVSATGGGELVQSVCMRDEDYEAEYIVREIAERVSSGSARYADHAILFRTAPQARTFEAELRMKQVPYVLVGGMSFFDRKEVRDVLAYLRLAVDPTDETALLRVVNSPPRGVGKVTLDRVLEFAAEQGIPVAAAFSRAGEIKGVSTDSAAVVARLLERLPRIAQELRGDLPRAVERVIDEVAYKAEVERCYPDEATRTQRWDGVEEVMNYAASHARRRANASLATFLDELVLCAEDREENAERGDAVVLMTLHASKGLEFPRVYLVGLEEGLLPHARALAENGIEEERRLAYVGITRARQALTLSWSLERARHGSRSTVHPSRFLFEIKGTPPPKGWTAFGTAPAARETPKKRTRTRRSPRA